MREMSLPEEPAGIVAGRLEGMSVPDLMWLLCRRRLTGVLRLGRGVAIKKVYFQDGHIVFAASSDPNERLGEFLLRDGLVDLEHLEFAVSRLDSGKRLGALLVEMGHLRPEDLVRGVIAQVREIVLELFTWEEGTYRFDEGPLPTREVITLGMKTGEILLQGIRRIRSFSRIRRSVGGLRQRFVLSSASRDVIEGLELNDGERLILKRLERGSASIEALCGEIYVSNFEIHQALWSLKVLGAVEEADGAADLAAAENRLEGRLGSGGIIEVLVRLCRAGETGVLHASRGPAERTFHLRGGRCVFATSNNIDDGLVAHLLRRGVISIRDREETARRLLSNKRVGTILLEMGVIDEQDLREMVREQMSEIVCDTFRWEDGEYTFVPGELPTIEEIVLEMSVEDLVSEGIRRVTSWSRVRAGCFGASEAPLALTSEYLGILDRMTVGAEEWEVVSCLGTPRTVLEICRRTTLGDFRVCQILWALRLLGAVREVAAPETGLVVPLSPGEVAGRPDEALAAEPQVLEPPGGKPPAIGTQAAPEPAPAVEPPAEPVPIPVAPADDTPAELVSETWRLTDGEFPAPSHEESPVDAAPVEGEPAVEAPSTHAEPVGEVAPEAPSGESLVLDSPAAATLILSRAEVEAALGLAAATEGGAQYELAEPGTGTDAPFAEAVAADVAGGRDFEIGEPSAEPSEAKPDEPLVPGSPFELAGARGTPPPEVETAQGEPKTVDKVGQTGEFPREEVARALGAVPEDAATTARRETPDSPPEPPEVEPPAPAAAAAEPQPAPQEVPAELAPVEDAIADLERAIGRFNQLHRVLYRAIRSEVGAGAVNFIHACRVGLDTGQGEIFEGSRLLPDGTWDPEGLKRAIRARRERGAWSGFESLLARELEMLRPQIDEARVQALRDQLSELERTS